VNQQLDSESAENSRVISDLTINLRELQDNNSALEKKKQQLLEEKELLEETNQKNAKEIESLKQRNTGLSETEAGLNSQIDGLKQEKERLTVELSQVKPDFDSRQKDFLQQQQNLEQEKKRLKASYQAIRLLIRENYLSTPETKIIEMIASRQGTMTIDILTASTGVQKGIIESIIGSLAKRGILEISESGEISVLKTITLFTGKED
ncbi:MAG: hypothetical protein ACFFD4_30405, partial [Candidatus Odinarchaeota archaeon]